MRDRTAFHHLTAIIDYPMLLVTAASGDERAGCLVGFSTQCSIDPPRYLVCISHANHTHGIASKSQVLALHLVGRRQRQLADLFGAETGDETDKFSRCRWEAGPDGVPLLADCPNRMVGRVVDKIDVGDHTAFVLDLVDASASDDDADDEPVLTFQDVRDMEPGHPA